MPEPGMQTCHLSAKIGVLNPK
uniref:Uncharacterized protein n=1 Tax=Anguilla anguilla TaxID=7936 RepID=A0A0E9VUG1_ANGAN